jgi:hypothetical protein
MKILYLTKGDHVDYQNDCLLIGLKELFGADVVDYNKQAHNYTTYDEVAATKLYGMGMSVTRVLPDLEVDRTDITSKIKNNYFDFVVYGSIWRCGDYVDEILQYYPPNKVIAVDGEDETHINRVFDKGILYFKRELIHKHERLLPISFAIPTSKINFNINKIKDFSYITPLDRKTYIYKNERDYYNDYNEARFGVTMKKAGWDCMRHYEILANGCIPYFINLDKCPVDTMTTFPKEICLDITKQLGKASAEELYKQHVESIQDHVLNNNTTKALATSFIDTITSYEKI